jgi:short-subunit dehydrogenase
VSKVIAIIGVGPGVGMSVARKFGSEGFAVALLARRKDKLEEYVAQLSQEGIESRAYVADVTDRAGLIESLGRAKAEMGSIDVVEYSPASRADALVPPRDVTIDNVQPFLDQFILSPIAVVQEVLPDMLEAGDGALLFCTAASAMRPVPFSSNFAIGAGGLLNYTRALHDSLRADGIYAGIVAIAGLVIEPKDAASTEAGGAPSTLPAYAPEEVADLFWELYTKRDRAEAIVGDIDKIHQMLTQGSA